MDASNTRFPWWILGGGLVLAALYLPTLGTPFDFLDDGNLVYPSARTSFGGHVELWWEKVKANYEHLGPFRPTALGFYWELQANLFGGGCRSLANLPSLIWCTLSAGTLLWLMRELGVRPIAAMFATALAMWNPYQKRNMDKPHSRGRRGNAVCPCLGSSGSTRKSGVFFATTQVGDFIRSCGSGSSWMQECFCRAWFPHKLCASYVAGWNLTSESLAEGMAGGP